MPVFHIYRRHHLDDPFCVPHCLHHRYIPRQGAAFSWGHTQNHAPRPHHPRNAARVSRVAHSLVTPLRRSRVTIPTTLAFPAVVPKESTRERAPVSVTERLKEVRPPAGWFSDWSLSRGAIRKPLGDEKAAGLFQNRTSEGASAALGDSAVGLGLPGCGGSKNAVPCVPARNDKDRLTPGDGRH